MSFTWSFSALDNFETCARKHYAYNVAKTVKDDSTENIDWGNYVHDAMRDALRKIKPLPSDLVPYQIWIDRVLAGPGELQVENKYALDQTCSPCGYRAPVVWYRGRADALRLDAPLALAIDWKTGKPKDNPTQLGLMALCIFQHHANVKLVRTDYIWLQEDPRDPEKCTTQRVWRREDMPGFVSELLPRVQKLKWAHDTQTWAPNPSGLCIKYCKETSCPFHGKGNRS
jgi:hypothetical protein